MFDNLGNRMKKNYEDRYRIYLTRRTPVIIRVDGNAFHTFTHGLNRPFDADFMEIMQKTCLSLCQNIQGCVGGYVQSDEISLLLVDYQTLESDAWFDYNLQKITSIAAAHATMTFNGLVRNFVDGEAMRACVCAKSGNKYIEEEAEHIKKYMLWESKIDKAIFDARAFNVPKEEVCNYFIWRQKDATRNSIQAAGQAFFSQKELDHKSQSDIQEMLFQRGVNWNDYSTYEKRGSFVRRIEEKTFNSNDETITRHRWAIDLDMPILTGDRNYINELVFVGE